MYTHLAKPDSADNAGPPKPCFSNSLLLALELVRQEVAGETRAVEARAGFSSFGALDAELPAPMPLPPSRPMDEEDDEEIQTRHVKASNLILERIAAAQTKECIAPNGGHKTMCFSTDDGHNPPVGNCSPHNSDLSLAAAQQKQDAVSFTFPRPAVLEGVKSRKKMILRMEDVGFRHAGKDKPVLQDASLRMSQASRTLVVGGKLVGKTSLAMILGGEATPSQGTLMKASGVLVSCITENTLQRLEDHWQKSPVQYMLWRFAENVDQEATKFQKFADRQVIACKQLERQVVSSDIAQFLNNFGLPQETAHKPMAELSRDMKAKLGLAAAMWQSPHILLVDEPAKLFSAEDSRALLQALKEFKGGVLITTHTRDQDMFEEIATEKFFLKGGQLNAQGQSSTPEAANADLRTLPAPLSAKDAKNAIKDLEKALRDGANNKMSHEEMQERVAQLKEKLLA
jgi:ABC-type multidrug transport system ATPase subunit